jgi:hypothetical protein
VQHFLLIQEFQPISIRGQHPSKLEHQHRHVRHNYHVEEDDEYDPI